MTDKKKKTEWRVELVWSCLSSGQMLAFVFQDLS